MRLVIVESPYACQLRCGKSTPAVPCEHVRRNEAYARAALLDCLRRGEAPTCSHLLYTQVLFDGTSSERLMGIEAGLAWGKVAQATVVYGDLGLTGGMLRGIDHAEDSGRIVEHRRIEGWGGKR